MRPRSLAPSLGILSHRRRRLCLVCAMGLHRCSRPHPLQLFGEIGYFLEFCSLIVWGAFSSKPSEQEVQKIRHPLVVEAGTLHLYFHSRTQGRDRLLYGPCLLSHRSINPHDALREVVNGKPEQSLVPPQTCGRACGLNSTGPGCPPRLRSSSCRSSRLVVSANRPLEGF